jgi:Aromatic-ring-opening dioxygenase LigAB, LigA subunit
MSLYQLQKLIYHVKRDPFHRERYRQDPAAFIKDYELNEEESSAAVSVDVRKLYALGVHSLLLRPFTPVTQSLQRGLRQGSGRIGVKRCPSFLPAARAMLPA